ncbi:MAG: hypothetical protein QW181_01885, partial [Candidatus Nitrosocaldus sp.]
MREVDLRRNIQSIDRDEFLSLLDNVMATIKQERANARVGYNSIMGGLVRISSFKQLIIIGDVHG